MPLRNCAQYLTDLSFFRITSKNLKCRAIFVQYNIFCVILNFNVSDRRIFKLKWNQTATWPWNQKESFFATSKSHVEDVITWNWWAHQNEINSEFYSSSNFGQLSFQPLVWVLIPNTGILGADFILQGKASSSIMRYPVDIIHCNHWVLQTCTGLAYCYA